MVALDPSTGKQIWKTYTIAEKPKVVRKNSIGMELWGPAGSGVWNSPTIDAKRKALYIGTGDAYTSPAAKSSDGLMALDLATGKVLWSVQDLAGDAWLVGCPEDATKRPENCPKELGPDYDFGSSPILKDLPGGKRVLVAGQKSGMVWAHDPDNRGAVVWKTPTTSTPAPASGQIVWGGAADDGSAYFGLHSGGIVALQLTNGERRWFTQIDPVVARLPGEEGSVSAIPGAVFCGWLGRGAARAFDGQRERGVAVQYCAGIQDNERRSGEGRIDCGGGTDGGGRNGVCGLGVSGPRRWRRVAGERAAGVWRGIGPSSGVKAKNEPNEPNLIVIIFNGLTRKLGSFPDFGISRHTFSITD